MSSSESFNQQFEQNLGSAKGQRILCAVSGGVDSMVMLNLFLQKGLKVAVAHCNFKLRGSESDNDEKLVKDFCDQHSIPVFTQSFDTLSIAADNQTGIQETARKLRYEWFDSLLAKHQYDLIATAHHADDNAETILFNIVRGTGMTGASGIPRQTNRIIRPLLNMNKSEILAYAAFHQIPFRNDESNNSSKYARNKMRLDVIPLLSQINARAVEHINNFGHHSKIAMGLIEERTKEYGTLYMNQSNELTTLRCNELVEIADFSFWLFELLKPFGTNQNTIQQITECLIDNRSGAVFFTSSHKLMINRLSVLIQPLSTTPNFFSITMDVSDLPVNVSYLSQTVELDVITTNPSPLFNPSEQLVDLASIGDSITIRNWKAGDRFIPLGMTQHKKVSDYLSDGKISIYQKALTLVLESREQIIAIIGHQINNSFKVTSKTNRLLRIRIK